MIDIGSKISSFRKLVWDLEKRKSEDQLYDSINTSSEILDKKKADLEKNMESYLEKRKVFATTRRNELVARKTEEEKSTFNIYKEELLKETIEAIKNELVAYSKTSAYKKNLKKEVEEVYKNLKETSDKEYILLVKESDQKLFEDYKTDIMGEDMIGGFIFEDESKSYQYDFSLKRKLEDEKYQIGKKLYSLLEGGESKK
jgi:vacuolar-type H+-ATPase subunit E/Vma4